MMAEELYRTIEELTELTQLRRNAMTANELRARVCAQARQWLGLKEADGSHRQIIDIYNTIRPLPRGYRMTYSDPWCAAFVSAVGAACGLTDVILPECACDQMIAAFWAAGRIKSTAYVPIPGDLVFYDWDGDGRSDHVGIVASIASDGLHVIEGNYSDAVKTRVVSHGCKQIYCYAVPDYEAAADHIVDATDMVDEDGEELTGASILDRPEGAVVSDDIGSGLTVNPEPDNYIDTSRVTISLPVLRYGDSINNPDEAVRAAQLLLIGRGYRCGPWGADGEAGTATDAAVRAFQRSRGLAVDGVIGAKTWAALLGLRA